MEQRSELENKLYEKLLSDPEFQVLVLGHKGYGFDSARRADMDMYHVTTFPEKSLQRWNHKLWLRTIRRYRVYFSKCATSIKEMIREEFDGELVLRPEWTLCFDQTKEELVSSCVNENRSIMILILTYV
jgi:hypothetical protein